MADSTVHSLPGSVPVDTDEFYIARSPYGAGNDFKTTAAQIRSYIGAGRQILTADLTLYVNADTGVDTNLGTSTSPFQTILKAWIHLSSLDQNGFTVTIQLQDAVAHYPGLTIYANSGPTATLIVPFSSGNIVMNGNAVDPTKTVISDDVYGFCFEIDVSFTNELTVQNVKLGAANLFYCTARCNITFTGNLIFGDETKTIFGFYAGTGSILNVGGSPGLLNFMPTGNSRFMQVYNSYAAYYGTLNVQAAQDFAAFMKVQDGGVLYWYPTAINSPNLITGPAFMALAGGDMDIANDNSIPIPGGKGIMYPAGTNTWVLKGMPLAQLPNAASTGVRLVVTDATAPAFGQPVVGGGAVVTPVYWDGAAWMVG